MENWITFVGEGRSGHTIISAILGSHPHVKMGEEQKYISRWYRENWTRNQILKHLNQSGIGRARSQLNFSGILEVKEPLLSVGDKCGWDAVNEYRKRNAPSSILTDFSKFIKLPVKTIVSLRHPLDNISAWVMSPKYQRMYGNENLLYRRMIRRYKRFHDAANNILKDQDIFYWHNENLISDPELTISSAAEWLDLPIDQKWLNMCVDKVFKKPNKRSTKINWPDEYKQRVLDYIQASPLLENYR